MRNIEIRGRSKNLVTYYMKPLVPIVGKGSILNVAEFLDLLLKTLPCTETSPVLCENHFFLIISKCGHLY